MQDIDDLQIVPTIRELTGYAVNIRRRLMADDLKPFAVTPSAPARRFHDDLGKIDIPLAPHDPMRPGKLDFSNMMQTRPVFPDTVFLVFPDLDAALASSLGEALAASLARVALSISPQT